MVPRSWRSVGLWLYHLPNNQQILRRMENVTTLKLIAKYGFNAGPALVCSGYLAPVHTQRGPKAYTATHRTYIHGDQITLPDSLVGVIDYMSDKTVSVRDLTSYLRCAIHAIESTRATHMGYGDHLHVSGIFNTWWGSDDVMSLLIHLGHRDIPRNWEEMGDQVLDLIGTLIAVTSAYIDEHPCTTPRDQDSTPTLSGVFECLDTEFANFPSST